VTDRLARRDHLAVVGSTNDVVRGWLADGTPEVCLATADDQTAGRGREGRTWLAPAGAALLLSLGFRPTWLAAGSVWRLTAITALAMAEAAETEAGLAPGTVRLKWPNDLVIETTGVRKLAGILGETEGLGTSDPRVVVGLGLNADWPASRFPPELASTMTSLRDVATDRDIDRDRLLDTFLDRLEPRLSDLRRDRFDGTAWSDRQVTTGRPVDLVAPDGSVRTVRAVGVDAAATGALLIEDAAEPGGQRAVVVGEIRHVRVGPLGATTAVGV
jgi:BirA family transcriptional regulator, biotin operon repressor / biotin---[acetyl-CoA-carboxylase] ligase